MAKKRLQISAHVSHDCRIGSSVFIGTNAVVCGRAQIGEGAYVAPNATIRDDCQVGRFALVGLGSVVTRNLADYVVATGIPARPAIRRRSALGKGLASDAGDGPQ